MQDDAQQPPQPEQTPPKPTEVGSKVIQPTESSLADIRNYQAAQAVAQPPPVQPASQLPPSNTIPQASPVPSSVYPEPAVPGPNLIQQSPATQDSVADRTFAKNSNRAWMIRSVATAIIVLNVVNAYTWFVDRQTGIYSWIRIVEIAASLVLAVGIFQLKESARSLYVTLSVILIVLSTVGFIIDYVSLRNVPAAHHALTASQIENSIKAAQTNPSFTPRERQLELNALNRLLQQTKTTNSPNAVKRYLSDSILIVVAVGPILFLTRPSIKSSFS